MKRLLILSLLMIQGVWGAGADGADVQSRNPRILREMALLQVMLPILTRLSDALAQDPNAATNLQDANNLEAIMIMYDNNSERMITDAYVAWLNADVTRAIVVRQNAVQACQQMGIANVPEEWAQLIVDVSPYLRDGITSLHTRPGTIAHLVHTNKIPAVMDGRLYILNRNLAVCDAWNIPNAGALTHLYLYNNQLETLPDGTFAGLGALRALYLNENQLTTLAPGTFAGLGALRELHLNGNQLTTLAPGTFAGLVALESLYLYINQLTTLAPGTFAGLDALTHLYLNHNQLTTLADGTFAGLGALRALYLNENQLTTLAPGTFAGLGALTRLYLYGNQLTTLAPGTFAGLGDLTTLNLSHNPKLQLKNSNNLEAIRDQHPEWFNALMGELYELHHKYRTFAIDSTKRDSAHIHQRCIRLRKPRDLQQLCNKI